MDEEARAGAVLVRRAVHIAGWSCVVLLAVLSLLPKEEMVRTGLSGHIEHAMAYAGTALLFSLSHRGPARIAAALMAYAALLESLQALSPGRHPALADWIASSAGVLVGVAVTCTPVALWPAVRAMQPASEADRERG
jgi:VanZ family protein